MKILVYRGLDTMQRLLSELRAVHDPGFFRALATQEQRKELAERPKTIHPVVRTHPVTGRKGLFVNSTFTRKIEGMKGPESQSILRFLYEHLSSPDYTCRFRWEPNSIAMWDNRCALHHAMWDYFPQVRSGRRVTVQGDKPF